MRYVDVLVGYGYYSSLGGGILTTLVVVPSVTNTS